MKDVFLYFFDTAIIVLIIWWIVKVREENAEAKRRAAEWDKPENQFKRRKREFFDVISEFLNADNYPYIVLPAYNVRLTAYEPLVSDPIYLDENNTIELKIINEGRCEKFFYDRLIKRFEKKYIKIGNVYVNGYYPDIAYIDIDNKIFIDIEIDEPYSLKDKKPIHHFEWQTVDLKRPLKTDTNRQRDYTFRDKGWTTVRFSEDQILQNAKECVDIVNAIVDYWSDTYAKPRDIDYTAICQKRWATKDAYELAKALYRESNIETKILAYIQKENKMQYDSKYELPYRYDF